MTRIAEISERVAAPENIEIVSVELKGRGKQRLVRIFIDKPEGVTHGDCEFISKNVGTILDVEDVVTGGSYTLQVSSPGVERPLVKASDYERFTGKRVKILLREPVADKRHWEGTLAGFSSGVISLEAAKGELVKIEFAKVRRANLKFDW